MQKTVEVKPSSKGIVLRSVFAVFFLCLYLFPFFLVLINSLKRKVQIVKYPLRLIDEKGLQWNNYKAAVVKMDFARSFFNRLSITVFSV